MGQLIHTRAAMNNVRKYRSKAKLSQRALAAMVGVSQQTIQRIEVEAVTVRVETAMSLARALKAPLRSLFPELRDDAGLEGREPQRDGEKIDYSCCSHTLSMQFSGGLWRMYSVDQATAERVRFCLFSEKVFIAFNTDKSSVLVNSRKLLWTNILFDPGHADEEEVAELLLQATMYFDDGPAPHIFQIEPDSAEIEDEDADESANQLQHLVTDLDAFDEDSGVRYFTDEDGEEVIFNPHRLAALEIPLEAVNPKLMQAVYDAMDEDGTVIPISSVQ
jgi:DNA-binding XRE family transcriptional regulator